MLVLLAAGAGWQAGWAGAFCRHRARTALDDYRWHAAERWLGYCQILDPKNGEAEFLRARLSRKLGDLEAMVQHLEQAHRRGYAQTVLQREMWLAQAQGGTLAPLESRLADLLVQNEDLSEICEAFARGCLMTHRLEDAAQVLELWESDFPANPLPHVLKGRILEFQTNVDGAMEEYRRALEKDPQYGPAAYNLGRVLLTRQETESALKVYRSCQKTLYDPQPALVRIAQCLRLLGRLEEARAALTEAATSDSEDVITAWVLVGEPLDTAQAQLPAEWGYLESEAEHWEEAVRWFQEALSANPRDWRGRYAYATALRQTGQTEEAERQLKLFHETKTALASCDLLMRELKVHPENAEARYQIGKVLLEHVSPHQGLIWLNSALTYDPNHQPTHRFLAEYYAEHADENPEFARRAEEHAAMLRD